MKKLLSLLSLLAAAVSVSYAQTNKFIAVGWNTNNAPVGSVPFVRSATSNGWTAGNPGESQFLAASNSITPYPHFQPIYGSNVVGGVTATGSSNVFQVVSNLTVTNTWVTANISDSNITTVAAITANGNPYDIRWDTHMQIKWDGNIDANVRLLTWFTYTDVFGVSTTNTMFDLLPYSTYYLSYHIDETYSAGGNARPDIAVNTDYGWTAGSAFFTPKSNTSITISALRVGSSAISTGGATNVANYYFTSIGNGSGSSGSPSGLASNVYFLDSPSISWSQIGGSNYAIVTAGVSNDYIARINAASNSITLATTNFVNGSITTTSNGLYALIGSSTNGGVTISNTVARQEYFYTNTANLFRSNQFTFTGGGMNGQTGYAPGASYGSNEYVIDFTTSVQGNPDFFTPTQLFNHIKFFATNQLATGHTPAGFSQSGGLQTAGYAYHSDFYFIELAYIHFRKTDHPFIYTNLQANLSNALNYVQRSNNIPVSFGTNANLYDGWGPVEFGYNSYSAAHYKHCCDLMAIMAMRAGQPLVASNYVWQAQVIRAGMTNLWDETRGLLRTCSQGTSINTHSLAANALAVLFDACDDRLKNRIEEEFVKYSGHNNGFFQYGALRTYPIGECLDAAVDPDCDGTDNTGYYQTGGYWPWTWGVEVVARRNPDVAEAMMKDMYTYSSINNRFSEWWNTRADTNITAVTVGSSNYLNTAGIPATYLLTGKFTDAEKLLLDQARDNAFRPKLGLVAGANVTLTPGSSGVVVAASGGSGSGTSNYLELINVPSTIGSLATNNANQVITNLVTSASANTIVVSSVVGGLSGTSATITGSGGDTITAPFIVASTRLNVGTNIIGNPGSVINGVGLTNGSVSIPNNIDVGGTFTVDTVNATTVNVSGSFDVEDMTVTNFTVVNPWNAYNATNIQATNISAGTISADRLPFQTYSNRAWVMKTWVVQLNGASTPNVSGAVGSFSHINAGAYVGATSTLPGNILSYSSNTTNSNYGMTSSQASINPGTNLTMLYTFSLTNVSQLRFFAGINVTASADSQANMIALRYSNGVGGAGDTNFVLISTDSGGLIETNHTGIIPAVDTRYELEITRSNSVIYAWINSAVKATNTVRLPDHGDRLLGIAGRTFDANPKGFRLFGAAGSATAY